MKRVCTYCDRESVDGNLWCQEPYCPAGAMPVVLGYGEWLGDIMVTRPLRVNRTAVMYEAERRGEPLLLKVAHDDCQELLKREAVTLMQLASIQQHPMLPVLLPAYEQSDLTQRPYGKTVFRGETKYYEVFEHMRGEFLRDSLLKNPQPWNQHAAWLIISLADAIAFMHFKGNRLHLNLSPDVVYVRYDRDGIPRPLLLDLGFLPETGAINFEQVIHYGNPAYIAPEVLAKSSSAGAVSDVYGLGLLFYEMLAGQPGYPFRDLKAEAVRELITRQEPPPLNRTDLAKDVHQLVHMALMRAPQQRQQDVRVFAKMVRTTFGEVPAERKGQGRRRLMIAGALLGLLLVALILGATVLT